MYLAIPDCYVLGNIFYLGIHYFSALRNIFYLAKPDCYAFGNI